MNRAKVAPERRNVRKNVQNMPGLIGFLGRRGQFLNISHIKMQHFVLGADTNILTA